MAGDTEHHVTVGEATVFVRAAMGVCAEEAVGGRLIDEIQTDVDGILLVLSNGQTFRVALFEVPS